MGIDILELSLIDEYILDQTKSGFEDLLQLEDSELETYYFGEDLSYGELEVNPSAIDSTSEDEPLELDRFAIPDLWNDEDPELDVSDILSESQIQFLENEEALIFDNDILHLEIETASCKNFSSDISSSSTECNLLDLDDLCQNFQKNMKLEFDDGREYTNEDEGHWYPDDRTMLGFPEDRQSRCPDEFMSSHFNEETDDSLPLTSMSQLTINEADESDVSDIFEIMHRIDWGQSTSTDNGLLV